MNIAEAVERRPIDEKGVRMSANGAFTAAALLGTDDASRDRPGWFTYRDREEGRRSLLLAARRGKPVGDFVKQLVDLAPTFRAERTTHAGAAEAWSSPERTVIRWIRSHARLTHLNHVAAWALLERDAAAEIDSLRTALDVESASFDENFWLKMHWDYFWPRMRWLFGADTIDFAGRLAVRTPESALPVSPPRRPNGYSRFLVFCFWESTLNSTEPIIVPGRRVGPILGVGLRTACSMREYAIEDGFLCLAVKGGFAQRKADEFQFSHKRWQAAVATEPMAAMGWVTYKAGETD